MWPGTSAPEGGSTRRTICAKAFEQGRASSRAHSGESQRLNLLVRLRIEPAFSEALRIPGVAATFRRVSLPADSSSSSSRKGSILWQRIGIEPPRHSREMIMENILAAAPPPRERARIEGRARPRKGLRCATDGGASRQAGWARAERADGSGASARELRRDWRRRDVDVRRPRARRQSSLGTNSVAERDARC